MNPTLPSQEKQTPKLFWLIFLLLIILSFIPTIWTSIDLSFASTFLSTTGQTTPANQWWWVNLINGYTPFLFRIMIGVCAVIWAVTWMLKKSRRIQFAMAFIVIAGAMGPGLIVNAVFKDNWNRARPFQVTQFDGTSSFTRAGVMTNQCTKNCSFVSGHVACGFFFFTLMLIDRRRQYLWAAIGIALGALIGFSRMAAGAHWLSDELWAGPITFLTSWIIWKIMLKYFR